jgi:hypothetical protein
VDETPEVNPEVTEPTAVDPATLGQGNGRAGRWYHQRANGKSPATEDHAHPDDAGSAPSVEDDQLLADDQPLLDEEPEYEDERARAFLAGGAYATVAIDRYDDLASVFGKIDAAPSPRVALVAARGNQELQRALSMRRLQRHLDLTGKDLILVTRSRALRLRAGEEDLPAVGSLRRVDFRTYGRGGLRLGWLTLRLPSLGALMAVLLLVGAVVAGAAVLFWYLPEAEVTVYLPVTPYEDTFDLTLDGQTTLVNLENGVVPARRREVVVSRSIYRPATAIIEVPNERAAVALRFTNRTNQPVVVPKGTVVAANNGMKFTVANDVNLPRQGATGDVVALAQQPGAAGNIPPNTAVQIEGDLGPRVGVTNPAPGERGTNRPQQVVGQGDVEGVRAFAEAVLIDAAIQDLRQRLAETATIIEPGASIEILDVQSTPPVNQPAKFADVRVTARASLLTIDDADLRQVYVNHFRQRLPPDQMLLEDDFTTTVVRSGDLERTTDRLPVTVNAQMLAAPYLDRAALRDALTGETKTGAQRVILGFLPDAAPPQVKLSPGWVPRLPRKADRIDITFAPMPP